MAVRAGIGYDVHKLEPGIPLWLGGVRVEFEAGLAGHSDGDVLVHALVDAMLGAAGWETSAHTSRPPIRSIAAHPA